MKINSDATQIEVKKSIYGGYRVDFQHPAYGNCVRFFKYKKNAVDYAAGKKINIIPNKGKELPISENAKNPAQDEEWTERKSHSEITTEILTGYHFGENKKAFFPKETCFYIDFPERRTSQADNYTGCYIVEVPAGVKVDFYDGDEFRVNLETPGIKIYQAKK